MARVRRLSVTVETNTGQSISRLSELNKKVKTLGQQFEVLGKKMEKFGKWGMTRITLPMLALGGVMINTASWAEEMGAKFNVVFADMAGAAERWAETQAVTIGRSKYDLMDFLAETQNLLVGMGMARAEAALFSQEIVQMGIDLASFENLTDADALNSMMSALSGVHTAARSFGAVLNENTLALAMQEMGLKGTFQQLDENRKIQVRFRAIVLQNADAIGNAEREAGSFTGQMKALKGEVKDLSIELGRELLPYATQLVGWLKDAADWFRDLDPEIKNALIWLGGIAALIPPLAVFGSWVLKVGGWIKAILIPVAGALGLSLGWAALIIAGIIFIIQDLITHLQGGASAFGDLYDVIWDFVLCAWGGIKFWWDNLKAAWGWISTEPANILANALDWMDKTISNWVESALSWIDNLIQGFLNIPNRIKEGLSGFGNTLKSTFSGALDKVRNLLPFSPVKDRTSPLADLNKAGMNIVGNIREGMSDAAARIDFGTPVAATAAPVMRGGGNYSFSPHVEINVQSSGDSKQTAQMTKTEVERMFPRLMDDFFRRAVRQS